MSISVARRYFRRLLGCAVATLLAAPLFAQAPAAPLSVLRVRLESPAKMKAGAPVKARTVDPLYSANRLLVPVGTEVTGVVQKVVPASRAIRMNARLRGDFTPLHVAQIHFTSITLANGATVPLASDAASEGSAVVRFHSAGSSAHQSLIHQAWTDLKTQERDTIHTVTAPGKADRLKQYVYSQLPYHPESIRPGLEFDVRLLQMPNVPPSALLAASAAAANESLTGSAVLHARLLTPLSSRTARRSTSVVAVVTEPLLNAQKKIEIPQGALLRGTVLQARAAKRWGRNGQLRFSFAQIVFPKGAHQKIEGTPSAVDGGVRTPLQLDSEGGVEAKTNKSIIAPLVLGLLSTSALHEDENGLGQGAVSSNGFALIGRIAALSSGSRIVGGTIGAVATARTVYTRFFAHGRDVVFPKDTRIEVEVDPVRAPQLHGF